MDNLVSSVLNPFMNSVLQELVSIKELLAKVYDKTEHSSANLDKTSDKPLAEKKTRQEHTSPTQDNEWTVVPPKKATKANISKMNNMWVSENPFQNLQFINNEDTDINSRNFEGFEDTYESSDCNDFPPISNDSASEKSYPVSNFKSHPVLSSFNRPSIVKRPSVVTTKNPENDDPAKYKRPKPKNVTLVVDSIAKYRVREFNQDLKDYGINNVNAKIHKFPAGTAAQIKDYTPRNVREDKSDGLLIHAGTNSLPRKDEDGNLIWTDEEIAQEIIDIGLRARKDGVRVILVSSLVVRRGRFFTSRISNINAILHELCHQNDFIFISKQYKLFASRRWSASNR